MKTSAYCAANTWEKGVGKCFDFFQFTDAVILQQQNLWSSLGNKTIWRGYRMRVNTHTGYFSPGANCIAEYRHLPSDYIFNLDI